MDFENIREEYISEVNYCNYIRRRRTLSETESQDFLSPDLFQASSDRSSAKARFSQSISPPRQAAKPDNGFDVSVNEGYEPRSRKAGEWHGSSHRRRQYASDDHDVEMGEPASMGTEFRRRAGSHGIRDLLRIRPRCNSHGEKHTDVGSPLVSSARGGNNGNVAPLSPGMPSSSTASSGSSSVSRFKVFLGAFRHRANSDSVSSPRTQLHGMSHFATAAASTIAVANNSSSVFLN